MSTADHAGAVLEVNLAAVVANWRLLCTMHPSGPVAGVVKADGYGLGARPIAQALYQAGCRHFFVALLDEALAIRELVPDAMLAVLCGLVPGNEPDHPEHDIVPVDFALMAMKSPFLTGSLTLKDCTMKWSSLGPPHGFWPL